MAKQAAVPVAEAMPTTFVKPAAAMVMPSATAGRRFGTDWCDPATRKPYHYDELLARGLLRKLESRLLADPEGEQYTQPAVCNAYTQADHAWRAEQRRPR